MVECQLLPWSLCRDNQFDSVQLEHGGFVRVSCVKRGLILIWTHRFEWHGREEYVGILRYRFTVYFVVDCVHLDVLLQGAPCSSSK